MISSKDPIDHILGKKGLLARALKDFEFRPSQIQMARRILDSLNGKKPAIIEAGTGTGKTLGYLVPVVLSGKKTVISTGTKNLQEQIFFKDIQILSKAIGSRIDALLMKGRKNYLCLNRYHQYLARPTLFKAEGEKIRQEIGKWLKHTQFADRAELDWLRDDDPVWDAISSSTDQCMGSECLHVEDCFLNALRRAAAQSSIVIVNHHLFFADLMVKKSGFGEIIPRFQVAVFDEAHHLEEVATLNFGKSFSDHQTEELVQDAGMENLRDEDKKKLDRQLDAIQAGTARLRQMFENAGERGNLDKVGLDNMVDVGLNDIQKGLNYIHETSGFMHSHSHALQALAKRAGVLLESLELITSSQASLWLKWYEKRKRSLVLHASPLDISRTMDELLYSRLKTMVFTSATLSTNNHFDYFQTRLGIPEPVETGIYPSHFDFEKQTLLYVPQDLPLPNHPDYPRKVSERVLTLLKLSSGRALVLFTSYHNLNLVYSTIDGKIPYTLLRQGDAPRSLLLEEFRQDTHSVLLATGSFWQGVDVPGEALSCLIIDKLPFGSPGDPIIAGRIESIRESGGNPFMDYQLPSAIIALKQGLGRLIRNSTDYGLLSVLDVRLKTSRYGRFFLDSLPKIPLSHDIGDVERFFRTKNEIRTGDENAS